MFCGYTSKKLLLEFKELGAGSNSFFLSVVQFLGAALCAYIFARSRGPIPAIEDSATSFKAKTPPGAQGRKENAGELTWECACSCGAWRPRSASGSPS